MTSNEKRLLDEKYSGLQNLCFEKDVERLASGEPLAYVIGYQPFLGLKIYLDSHPLIPRPETEWWTEQLLAQIGNGDSGVFRRATAREVAIFQQKNTRPPKPVTDLRFLDLCAGSGAIGCAALARLPNAQIYFGEIEPAHEKTILKNIRENHLDEARTDIRIGDLFEPFADTQFDIIATNPPYVPTSRVLPKSVADYEPTLALRAGEDGLDSIRRIAEKLPKHLAPGGVAWVECDRGHAKASRELFREQDLLAEIHTDQYGNPRVVLVSFP